MLRLALFSRLSGAWPGHLLGGLLGLGALLAYPGASRSAARPGPAPAEHIVLREGLVIGSMGRAGRWATHMDAIEAQIVAGRWAPPQAGECGDWSPLFPLADVSAKQRRAERREAVEGCTLRRQRRDDFVGGGSAGTMQ